MIKLSKRLLTIAEMVTPGSILCDVGCDHAHLDIYLLQKGIIDHALGMDVADGPLDIARQNLALVDLEDQCEIRKSNGLINYEPGEADTLVIAGMGGLLVESILETSPDAAESFRELILSPHSEVQVLRQYLHMNGFRIIHEKMVEEENKFYPVIKAVPASALNSETEVSERVNWQEAARKAELFSNEVMAEIGMSSERFSQMLMDRNFTDDLESKFGPCLIAALFRHEDETLRRYLMELLRTRINVFRKLSSSSPDSEGALTRLAEVSAEIGQMQALLFLHKNL